MSYAEVIDRKLARMRAKIVGISVKDEDIHPALYLFQRKIVRRALELGSCALFEDCGMGKTIQELEWARHVFSETGKSVLIFAPLAVGHQMVAEGNRIGMDVMQVRRQSDIPAGAPAVVTNYEMMRHFDPATFGGLVLDECFAPGTEIEVISDQGHVYRKHIEKVAPGDRIYNASGDDVVVAAHRREVPYAVKIKIGSTVFVSSPNHPIFTQRGWQAAQCLLPGDCALDTEATVRLVRKGVLTEKREQQKAEVLREILLSEMADDAAGTFGEGAQLDGSGETWCPSLGVASIREPQGAGGDREDSRAQPDDRSGEPEESISYIAGNESQSFRAWGEWSWADVTTGVFAGCSWRELDSGIAFVTGSADCWLSHTLQARFGATGKANRDRGGWSLPPSEEGERREERHQVGFSRVDSIEILELGHPELEGLRDADGKLYFYDIEAARHPSYSVCGFLVHNSSILKNQFGKMRGEIIDFAHAIPYRLAATATPAPNDLIEILNQASYLGKMEVKEAMSLWFTQSDGTVEVQKWRLKGHAAPDFWRWVGTWAIAARKPVDIGDPMEGFDLPALHTIDHDLATTFAQSDDLFPVAIGIAASRKNRRASIGERTAKVAALVNASTEAWVVWCELNDESDALAKAIPDAIEIRGSDSIDKKTDALIGFSEGRTRVLVTKASIAGHGLNWQHCAHMAFVGAGYSYEAQYQAIRRCWRYGQAREVHVHRVSTEADRLVIESVQRKEGRSMDLFDRIPWQMNHEAKRNDGYILPVSGNATGVDWELHHGDSVYTIDKIAEGSVGLSVFSPPFPGMYVYTDSPHDMGNVASIGEMMEQFDCLMAPDKMWRVLMPGRSVFIHITQGVAQLGRDGYVGMKDFRGNIIQMMESHGWHYYGEVTIDKNPQVKAIRTKDAGLMFKSLANDASRMHPALADMLLQFRKPGENAVPIRAGQSAKYGNMSGWVTPEDWILWARPVWYGADYQPTGCETVDGIRETDVLNVSRARSEKDERHLAPLQLGVIERCVKVWSNPGELVYSPFAGIGSEGVVALKNGSEDSLAVS